MSERSRDAATARVPPDLRGRAHAQGAGIRPHHIPVPPYRLPVLSLPLSSRIRADTAMAAARALFGAGPGDARRVAGATRRERVDALGRKAVGEARAIAAES